MRSRRGSGCCWWSGRGPRLRSMFNRNGSSPGSRRKRSWRRSCAWVTMPLVPDELKLLHCEDFRDDAAYPAHLAQLIRILREPPAPLGKLIAVPSLPAQFLSRGEGLAKIRDALRADLDRPVVISGAVARVGLHGMGGIGKSVLASALAHDRKVREAFPDGIVWIGLGSLPDLRARMQDVHRALGGDGAIATEHEGKEKLRDLIRDKAVLLVIDDVWRRGDADAFDILGARCRALITTARRRFADIARGRSPCGGASDRSRGAPAAGGRRGNRARCATGIRPRRAGRVRPAADGRRAGRGNGPGRHALARRARCASQP